MPTVLIVLVCAAVLLAVAGPNSQSVWNRFNRLTADFVLCDRDLALPLSSGWTTAATTARNVKTLTSERVPFSAQPAFHSRINTNPLPSESDLRGLIDSDIG
jgi:hypothetical protein